MMSSDSPFVCLALNSTQTSKDDLVFACESAARVITISPFYYVTVASAGAEIDVEFAAGFTYGTISDCSAAFISAREDKLVLPKRINEYFIGYPNMKKKIIKSALEHNSDREYEVIEESFAFIKDILNSETDEEIANLGVDDDYTPQSRKITEDEDKYSRAKSRDLEYKLENIQKEELAIFFNNMQMIRDNPPKSLSRINYSIFDDDEPTEMDSEANERLIRLSGRNTAINLSGSQAPIQIRSIRTNDSNFIIPNQAYQQKEDPSRIRVLGRGHHPPLPQSANIKIEAKDNQWDKQKISTYITELKGDNLHTASRSKSVAINKPDISSPLHFTRIRESDEGKVV